MIAFALWNGIHWQRLKLPVKKFPPVQLRIIWLVTRVTWLPPTISYTQNTRNVFSAHVNSYFEMRTGCLWIMSSIILYATWKVKIWTFPAWALNRSEDPCATSSFIVRNFWISDVKMLQKFSLYGTFSFFTKFSPLKMTYTTIKLRLVAFQQN